MRLDPTVGIPPEHTRAISRVEYERMADLGFFDNERVELLYGAVLSMTPPKPPHASCVDRLNALLIDAGLRSRALIRVQQPMSVSDYSEPEPDIAVVALGEYRHEHPTTASLVVEVAYSSLAVDRKVKTRLYAESNVAEYWIVNVIANEVERCTTPVDGAYTEQAIFRAGDEIALVQFPDVRIPVSRVL